MRRIDPHEIAWALANRFLKRESHTPWPMRSGQSKGPIVMWICDECSMHVLSTTTHTVPVCDGQ